MRRFSILLLILAYCHALNEDAQKQNVRIQMAKLLDINPDKANPLKSNSRSDNAAARYMQKLYFKHSQNPGPYEGSTVRSISPQLITSELENTDDMSQLIFNLNAIHPNERVLKAEIHFNQRIHRSNMQRASNYYKAKAWCSTCKPEIMLNLDCMPTQSRQWTTFVATDLVDDAIANKENQLKVQFLRRDIPILAPKSIQIHSPFLLIFTQQSFNSNEAQKSPNEPKRSKRSIDTYYQYIPVDDTLDDQQTEQKNTITNSDLDSDAVWRKNFEKFRNFGPSLLKERPPKKTRRQRFDSNDPMMGFGRVDKDDDLERNRVNKQPVNEELTVYLLGSEQKDNKQCGRRAFVVNFREIGWDEWIIAPKKFEAHYCAGSCEFPLAQNTNPSNHAQLQSIAHSMGILPPTANVCCAPDRMDSQTLLYYDESGNVVLKNYPKMIVSSCSCI